MSKYLICRAFGAVALALVSGCVADTEQSSTDAPNDVPTIVSLNPCSDAILAQVTAPGQLLAISHYSHDPAASSMAADQAARFESTGGTAEEILALAPDVVVADIFLAPATRAALERTGIRVVAVDIAATLEQSLKQVSELADLAGNFEQGTALSNKISAAWDAAEHRGQRVETLLWQQGGIVPGEQTLAAAMLEHTGFGLQSAARGLGQGAYLPLEQVLADPPELVLAAGDERMLTHPVMLRADASDAIAYRQFDPSLLYCGGPTIIRAVERLSAIRAELG